MTSGYEDATNILGLVVFSTVLGVTLGKMGPKGKPLLNFFVSMSEAVMQITSLVVWYVEPPFIFSNDNKTEFLLFD